MGTFRSLLVLLVLWTWAPSTLVKMIQVIVTKTLVRNVMVTHSACPGLSGVLGAPVLLTMPTSRVVLMPRVIASIESVTVPVILVALPVLALAIESATICAAALEEIDIPQLLKLARFSLPVVLSPMSLSLSSAVTLPESTRSVERLPQSTRLSLLAPVRTHTSAAVAQAPLTVMKDMTFTVTV